MPQTHTPSPRAQRAQLGDAGQDFYDKILIFSLEHAAKTRPRQTAKITVTITVSCRWGIDLQHGSNPRGGYFWRAGARSSPRALNVSRVGRRIMLHDTSFRSERPNLELVLKSGKSKYNAYTLFTM